MSTLLSYKVAGFSHTGKRATNEDRYCVLSRTDNNSVLVIVADGMGGHAGGALAAQTVIDCATDAWQQHRPEESAESFLSGLASSCHRAVVAAGKAVNLVPRATLAGLYLSVHNNAVKAVSVHVGDSRIMQFSGTGLIKQSVDHSLAQLKVLQGKIRQEDVATDADQNKVINSIGGEDDPEPEITQWDIEQGDRFVICSDGFWELFTPEDMLYLYTAAAAAESDGETLEEIVEQQFLSKLEKSDAQDNTTVVMLSEVNSKPGASRLAAVPDKAPAITSSMPGKTGYRVALAVAAFFVVVAIAILWFGGSDEPGSGLEGNDEVVQTDGSTDPTDNLPTGEPTGERIPERPTTDPSPAPRGERGGVTDGDALAEVDLELNVVVANDQEMLDAVTELLRNSGGLGSDDALVLNSETDIDGNRVLRLSQEYQGIPVFGGEIIVIQSQDTLTQLSGETGIDIEVDIEPLLSFEQAVAQAATSSGETITADGEGQLIIFDSAGTYHLAWIGLVSLESPPVRMVLDADDAAILARFPIQIEGNQQ